MTVCVYLSRPVADGKSWERGELVCNNATGVTIDVPQNYRSQRVFFPAHLVERMDYEGERQR